MNFKARQKYFEIGNSFNDATRIEFLNKNKPKYLYRYRNDSDQNLKNLLDECMWVSLPEYLNDPFEYEYGVYRNGALISCFTESYNSLLMWSHYSNSHKGYCIKYDFNDLYDYFNSKLVPVIYSSERYVATLSKSGNTDKIINTFIHKASEWKYEKEWRVINLIPFVQNELEKQYKDNGKCIAMPKPVEIIMGCRSSFELSSKIAQYCKKNNIKMSRYYMSDSNYKMYKKNLPYSIYEPSDIDIDKIIGDYLKTDAAKKDMKIIEESNKKSRELIYSEYKNFL